MSTPTPSSGLPAIGTSTRFRKTVTEAEVTMFAGLTGDLAPQHTDEEYMQTRPQGRRIAHGSYILALTSSASAKLCTENNLTAVSYGYERVRFVRPVFLGDTVQVDYTIVRVDEVGHKAYADMRASTDHGAAVVLVGTHMLYCYPEQEDEVNGGGGSR